jgi:hypothetical protein
MNTAGIEPFAMIRASLTLPSIGRADSRLRAAMPPSDDRL